MKSIGPLFVNTIKLKHPIFPMFEWGWSQETEHPYRASEICLVFWVPFVPRGYAFGVWGNPIDEDEALGKVLRKLDTPSEEIKKW
jgi:hypothetical protein